MNPPAAHASNFIPILFHMSPSLFLEIFLLSFISSLSPWPSSLLLLLFTSLYHFSSFQSRLSIFSLHEFMINSLLIYGILVCMIQMYFDIKASIYLAKLIELLKVCSVRHIVAERDLFWREWRRRRTSKSLPADKCCHKSHSQTAPSCLDAEPGWRSVPMPAWPKLLQNSNNSSA